MDKARRSYRISFTFVTEDTKILRKKLDMIHEDSLLRC